MACITDPRALKAIYEIVESRPHSDENLELFNNGELEFIRLKEPAEETGTYICEPSFRIGLRSKASGLEPVQWVEFHQTYFQTSVNPAESTSLSAELAKAALGIVAKNLENARQALIPAIYGIDVWQCDVEHWEKINAVTIA